MDDDEKVTLSEAGRILRKDPRALKRLLMAREWETFPDPEDGRVTLVLRADVEKALKR